MTPNTDHRQRELVAGLRDVLAAHVQTGEVPGVAALVARGDRVEVQTVGSLDAEGTAPVTRESIFRIASITKPIIAAAAMVLVDESRIRLTDAVDEWLPELQSRVVVRTPASPLDDVVPATRAITLFDLLTFRAGYGFPDDFSLPAVGLLFSELKQGPPEPQLIPPPEEWMAALSRIPLLHQPGEGWLYNTCSDILGVLISRVSGRPLPQFLSERLFEPLGMADTGFAVPPDKLDRVAGYYRRGNSGELVLVDGPAGQWSTPPAFPSGAGGLVSTLDDWHAFARMLLQEGVVRDRRLLSAQSVRRMTTNHITKPQQEAGRLFLEGQGWGLGGSVDVEAIDPWNVPGRYGWVGGTGTAAHLVPATGSVTILLSQVELAGPTPPTLMRDFWRVAA